MNVCSVTAENGMLCVRMPYHPGAVEQIKSLPAGSRVWDTGRKCWLIDSDYGATIQGICQAYYGEIVEIPTVLPLSTIQSIIAVYYIGLCKEKDGERIAHGLNAQGVWEFIFPETVLRSWFDAGMSDPSGISNLYAVLGIRQGSDEGEIKSAYRRVARQWHPDVCKEANAHEAFLRIQEAYAILSDPVKRAKYDAGLLLMRGLKIADAPKIVNGGYRTPLRCGLMLVTGVPKMGRMRIYTIHEWQDIINSSGQVMVSSWKYGDDKPTVHWI